MSENKQVQAIQAKVVDPMAKSIKIFDEAFQTRFADGFDNFASRIGLNNDNALSASLYTFNLLTRNRTQLEAAYRGSWVAGVIVDAVAEDMTRAGINVTTSEDENDIKDIYSAISRLGLKNSMCSEIKWSRLYGGALGVLQVTGQRLDTPLDVTKVAKGQFTGISVYDRWQLNPILNNVIQDGPDIGLPKFYQLVTNLNPNGSVDYTQTGMLNVHHSRVVRLVGIELPFYQAITEMMWGESNLERLWDRMIAFDNATMSCASLIDRANLRTVGVDGLRDIIATGGEAQAGLEAMFEMMRLLQVNEGLTLIDKNDSFASTAYSFAGLSDMMLQFGQQLAGASGIPLVRLFGQSPAGLSATGESDMRMYYDSINAQQEAKLRRPWDLLLKVLWRSVFGKDAPKDLEFTFQPLWQTSDLDKATIAKTNVESIIAAHEEGLVPTKAAMQELRGLSGKTGLFTNITDKDINDAEDEEPPMPGADPEQGQVEAPPKTPVKNLDGFAKRVAKYFKRKKK